MSGIASNLFILGNGPIPRSLAKVLRAPCVARNEDESGWHWDSVRIDPFVSLILVADWQWSQSQVIRCHADAWECPRMQQARCLVLVSDKRVASDLLRRDVFGRLGQEVESFSDWARCIAVLPVTFGLSGLLQSLAALKNCPVDTWKRSADEASVIPPLYDALRSRDASKLLAILPDANQMDWDALCHYHADFGGPHAYANLIRQWLRIVSSGVTLGAH